MRKLILATSLLLLWGDAPAAPANTPVVKDKENACWDKSIEIQGKVSMDKTCTPHGTIFINTSNTSLDCNGGTIDLQRNFDNGLVIESGGKKLDNVNVQNCVFKNSKFRTIYIGWKYPDREKEQENSRSRIYEVTPQKINLTNISIENTGSSGIYIDDYVQGVVIDRARIENSPAMAVYFEHSSKNNTLRGSQITNSGWRDKREAVSIDSSSNNLIDSNIFSNNKYGAIFLYRNCGEKFDQDKNQVLRWMPTAGNIIKSNQITGSKVGVWIASRQSADQQNIGCGIGYYGDKKYALDDAKNNTIENNKFSSSDIGVIVEDDDNKITGNQFTDISKIAIRIGTPMRSKFLGKPVKGTVVEQNKNSSSAPTVRYMWGSQDTQ